MQHVWVVEMWMGDRWEPCSSCRLTKHDGAMARRVWESNMPDDRFRIVKYVRSNVSAVDRRACEPYPPALGSGSYVLNTAKVTRQTTAKAKEM